MFFSLLTFWICAIFPYFKNDSIHLFEDDCVKLNSSVLCKVLIYKKTSRSAILCNQMLFTLPGQQNPTSFLGV